MITDTLFTNEEVPPGFISQLSTVYSYETVIDILLWILKNCTAENEPYILYWTYKEGIEVPEFDDTTLSDFMVRVIIITEFVKFQNENSINVGNHNSLPLQCLLNYCKDTDTFELEIQCYGEDTPSEYFNLTESQVRLYLEALSDKGLYDIRGEPVL